MERPEMTKKKVNGHVIETTINPVTGKKYL
jgi:hypothetical protein